MTYELRHFDTPLLRFSASEDTNSPEAEIIWQDTDKSNLLPLNMLPTNDSVQKWLRHRTVPE